MSWADGRLIGFDIETTGVDVEESRIVTAAVVHAGGGLPTKTETWIVDPGVEVPDGAAEVHGFTTERVRAEGRDPEAAVREIAQSLANRAPGSPVVVFNAPFDLTILDRECRRYGHVPLSERGPLYVIDPLVIDKHLHRFRRGSRRLTDQAAHYGAVLDDAHEASADALAACRVAWCIGKRGVIVRRVRGAEEGREKAALVREWERVRDDLPALHAAQVRWATLELARFQDYCRATEGKEVPEHREWPFTPLGATGPVRGVCPGCLTERELYDGGPACEPCVMRDFAEHG